MILGAKVTVQGRHGGPVDLVDGGVLGCQRVVHNLFNRSVPRFIHILTGCMQLIRSLTSTVAMPEWMSDMA